MIFIERTVGDVSDLFWKVHKKCKELRVWVEITTLLIPAWNDSDEELTDIANFIAGLGKEIPWHISRFYPQY